MKIILNHDGKELIVTSIHMLTNGSVNTVYAIDDETGDEQLYVNSSHSPFHSEDHVTVENLESKLKYVELIAIQLERIKGKRSAILSKLDQIAADFIKAYSSENYDSVENKMIEIQKEYYSIFEQIKGLDQAITILEQC